MKVLYTVQILLLECIESREYSPYTSASIVPLDFD